MWMIYLNNTNPVCLFVFIQRQRPIVEKESIGRHGLLLDIEPQRRWNNYYINML